MGLLQIEPVCHSEERSDEEAFFVTESLPLFRERSFAMLRMTRGLQQTHFFKNLV